MPGSADARPGGGEALMSTDLLHGSEREAVALLWRRQAVVLLGGLLLVAAGLRLAGPDDIAWLQNFLIVFGALMIEALPFVLLGAFVSALIEVYVPVSVFTRIARLPRALQMPAAGLAGMAFPVCECGSVPVARRLAAKGLAPAAAVTFMLASPIINPIVIASTVVAYRGRPDMWAMVLGRAGLGLVVAIAVGWVIGAGSREQLLKLRADDAQVDLHHPEPRWTRFFGHLSGDFLFMAKFLVMGAAVAAGVQTFVPQSVIAGVAGTPILDLAAMMGLAFLLSLCSESDAFVAASFVQFGVGAQLAFLVFGPMVDTKLVALYAGTFNRGFVRSVVLTVFAVTLVGTLWLRVLFG